MYIVNFEILKITRNLGEILKKGYDAMELILLLKRTKIFDIILITPMTVPRDNKYNIKPLALYK